jgi:hypothetical protein
MELRGDASLCLCDIVSDPLDCKAVANLEGNLKENETSGGERDIEVKDDKVAPWCVPSSSRVITIATGCKIVKLSIGLERSA